MLLSRTDRSHFSQWWWTVDRMVLVACIILMVVGLVLSLAASPAVAIRLDMSDEMHFVKKQIQFMPIALFLILSISFITSERILRFIALALFFGGMVLLVSGLLYGVKIKGSYRWVSLGFITLQPSEFIKPGFVILSAWLFSQGMKHPKISGNFWSFILFASFISLLVLQPDMGQTMLVTTVWVAMFFLSGASLWILAGFLGIIGVGGFYAYSTMSHVAARIDGFLNPAGSDNYQVDLSRESFIQGGWFGKGPGESSIKSELPDAHTDFIFAVAGEEFGIIGCLLIVAVFSFITFNFLRHAFSVENMFKKLSITGLTILFGMQAFINMGVNLKMLPAKGMTLPFISSGGSSLMSMAITVGLLLALTRRQPHADQLPIGGRYNQPLHV